MSGPANPARGETMLCGHVLRPSFAALVAAEDELGPLFALIEQAAAGQLRFADMIALFWHCRADHSDPVTREAFSATVTEAGLAAVTPALKCLISQILRGR